MESKTLLTSEFSEIVKDSEGVYRWLNLFAYCLQMITP